MYNEISLNFILKAKENTLLRSYSLDKLFSENIDNFMTYIPDVLENIQPSYDQLDDKLKKYYYLFLFDILKVVKDSWIYNFFISDFRFEALDAISKNRFDFSFFSNVDKNFLTTAQNSLLQKRDYISNDDFKIIIEKFKKFKNFNFALYDYKNEILKKNCNDKLFHSIFKMEIDIINIKKILFFLISGEKKTDFIIHGNIHFSLLKQIINMKKTDILQKIGNLNIKSLLNVDKKEIDFILIDKKLDEDLYNFSRNSLYHLLGQSSIYSFILAKKMEIKNLRIILSTKYLDIKKDIIYKYLYNF